MVGWYRKFIPAFAHTAKPLFSLLKNDSVWEWNDEHQHAFEKLRDVITRQPVLTIADPNKHYVLETDASDVAIGAVLQQEDEEGYLHPVAYASRLLSATEQRYSTTDREALAIPWALEHFNTYCEGHKYTALTDHAALRYMLNNKETTPRMHRMVARLSPYEITLHYRAGSDNHAADLLSRSQLYMESKKEDSSSSDNSSVSDISVSAALPITVRRSNRLQQQQTSIVNNEDVVAPNSNNININNNRLDDNNNIKKKKKVILSEEEYEVERIIDRRIKENTVNEYEYNVKWLGYDTSENTWESLDTLKHSLDAVIEYENERQLKEMGSKSLIDDVYECDDCGVKCDNPTSLLIHRNNEHDIKIPASDIVNIMPIDRQIIISLQQQEQEFKYIYEHLNHANKQDNSASNNSDNQLSSTLTNHQQRSLTLHEFVIDEDGMLYCIDLSTIKSKAQKRVHMRVCIPMSLRQQLMQSVHNNMLSAHPGIVRMIEKLKIYVWWPGMQTDIVRYVSECLTCQRVKQSMTTISPQAVRLAVRPWQQLGIDAVGPLPKTHNNNEYIIDVVDHFTRYVEGWAAPEINMIDISKKLIDKIVCRYGLFETLVSDRGSVFVGTLIAHVYKALKIHKTQTTAYHPQANGMIEVFHRTLKQTLKLWSIEYSSEWDELLPYAIFSYNTAFHTILQEVPHYLNHGYDAQLPIDLLVDTQTDRQSNIHHYAYELVNKLKQVHQRVKDILLEVNKERNNDILLAKVLNIKIGDYVYIYDPSTRVGESSKLKVRWIGPYRVISQVSQTVYVIDRDGKSDSINIERLKKQTEINNDTTTFNHQHQSQMQQIEASINELQQSHIKLLERKRLLELQHQQHEATAIATSMINTESIDINNELSKTISAVMVYVHEVYIKWL